MNTPRAIDVPEYRAELIDYMRSDIGSGVFEIFKGMGLLPVGGTAQEIAAAETMRLAGDLYFVGADMVELARHAAASLPEFKLAPEDLPSKSGFLVFETPIGTVKQDLIAAPVPKEYSIGAASWGHFSTGRGNTGAWISWYSDQRASARPATRWPTRYAFDHEFIVPFEVQHTSFVDPFRGEVLDGVPQLLDLLRVTWLLMQQPIARSTQVETYGASSGIRRGRCTGRCGSRRTSKARRARRCWEGRRSMPGSDNEVRAPGAAGGTGTGRVRIHDYRQRYFGHDYAFTPDPDPVTARIVGWGRNLRQGDLLIIPRPDEAGKAAFYRIETLRYERDPDDMWWTTCRFVPGSSALGQRAIEAMCGEQVWSVLDALAGWWEFEEPTAGEPS